MSHWKAGRVSTTWRWSSKSTVALLVRQRGLSLSSLKWKSLRQFTGSAGGSIPGVTSPLFGSTDVYVGAVRVGSLLSEDPESPGVLVIESETGAGPSILMRLESDANRRDLVPFDGGYAVLTVVEITEESFSGTWSSGARSPDSEGFYCATASR